MNYLAHIYLSEPTPEGRLGGLLGDFVKGSLQKIDNPLLRQSIELHRRIDSFTDTHPTFLSAKSLFQLEQRRYAGILLDIFYDHFLARNFKDLTKTDLEHFVDNFYKILLLYNGLLPEPLKQSLPRLVSQNWLCAYATFEGLEKTLQRMSLRIRRGETLLGGLRILELKYTEFERSFYNFFPAVVDFAARERQTISQVFSD